MPTVNRVATIDPVTADGRRRHRRAGRAARSATDATRRCSPRCTSAPTTACGSTTGGERAGAGDRRRSRPGARARRQPQLHSAGQVFVAACDGSSTVRVVTESNGRVSAPAATGTMPCGLLRDRNGAVYVANTGSNTVMVYTPRAAEPDYRAGGGAADRAGETAARYLGRVGQRHGDRARSDDARRRHHARDRRHADGASPRPSCPRRASKWCSSPTPPVRCASSRRAARCCGPSPPAR